MRGTADGLAGAQGAAHGRGDEGLVVGDGEADRDAAALVEVGAAPGQLADLGHHLFHEGRHADGHAGRREVGLVLHDAHFGHGLVGVVRADLRAEAVLERRDDAAAVGVVLGVGRGHQHDVEGQADAVAPDLHVALFEDVEQTDLDALGEVGQLVDGEDAAVDPRDEAVVQGQLVAQVPALGDFDGVDLADEVGDGGVGSGQLLAVALRAVDPVDRRGLAQFLDPVQGVARDRVVGVVVDFGAGDDGHPLVQQADQGPDDPGLGLTALAQEDEVVAGQDGVLQLGDDGLLEAEDAGHERLALGDELGRVAAHLLGHRDGLPAAGPQVGQGGGEVGGGLESSRVGGGRRVELVRGAAHGASLRLVPEFWRGAAGRTGGPKALSNLGELV